MRELRIEQELRDLITALGWLCLKINPLGLWGIPDRLVLAPGGRAIFVELKCPDGDVKPKQVRWHDRLRKLGFQVEVLWTLEQVRDFSHRVVLN